MNPNVTLTDDPRLDAMAAEWLRKHRHGVDTSEAYDDLRDLLARARQLGLDDLAREEHERRRYKHRR